MVLFLIVALMGAAGCGLPAHSSRQPMLSKAPQMSNQAKATFAYLRYLHLSGEQALQALDAAIELDPSPELYIEKIQALWDRQDYAQAEQTARDGLRSFPDHGALTMALIRSLWAQDKTETASSLLSKTIDKHPENWNLRTRLARLLLQENDPSRALDVLKSIPEKDRTANVHYFMAQAHTDLGNRKQTIDHLQKATRLKPSFRKAWAELAYQYELNRDFVAAEKAYSTLLQLGETNQEVIIRLIELNLKLNNPDRALELITDHQDDRDLVLSGIGLLLHNNFPEQARQALQGAGPEIVGSPRGLLYQAILAWDSDRDLDRALSLLRQVPGNSGLYQRALALRCQLLWEKNSPEAALDLARQGQNLYPEQDVFYSLESKILRAQGDTAGARKALNAGLKVQPENTDLLFQLGVLDYEQDRVQSAMKRMDTIISLDPEHARALNFLGYTLVEQGRDLDRAKILIQKALALDPENGYYLDSLAWYHYTVGHHEQAWKAIRSATSLISTDPVIWEHYGDIARAMGKTAQARKAYLRALDSKPEHPKDLRHKLQALPDQTNGTDAMDE